MTDVRCFNKLWRQHRQPKTKLRTLTNASTVEISSGRYEDALALLNAAADFLAEVSDDGFMAVITRNVDLYTEILAGQRMWTMP